MSSAVKFYFTVFFALFASSRAKQDLRSQMNIICLIVSGDINFVSMSQPNRR